MRTSPLWLSLGENCLPDDILKRHGRKSFSSPYSSGRTNIDYALALEKEDYAGLLEEEHLVYGDAWGKTVVRSSLYTVADDIFEAGSSKGFEFTHHDVLASLDARNSYQRKIERLRRARGTQDVLFLYHHRATSKTDYEKLRAKLKQFSSFYRGPSAESYMVLFSQAPVVTHAKRRVEVTHATENSLEFTFHTERIWNGDFMWAREDDDLIAEMLNIISRKLQIDSP